MSERTNETPRNPGDQRIVGGMATIVREIGVETDRQKLIAERARLAEEIMELDAERAKLKIRLELTQSAIDEHTKRLSR